VLITFQRWDERGDSTTWEVLSEQQDDRGTHLLIRYSNGAEVVRVHTTWVHVGKDWRIVAWWVPDARAP